MLDWLTTSTGIDEVLTGPIIATRMLAALVFGAVIAIFYRVSHGSQSRDAKAITTTLVLLAALIAMVTMVIGSNVARAFSLVGALSIVRFRTVVEDTRDTAFVIFSVIAGMAVGCDLLVIPVIGVPMVGATAWLLSRLGDAKPNGQTPTGTLVVRIGLGRDPEAILAEVLSHHVLSHRLIETGTARQGSALEVSYRVRLRSATRHGELIAAINQIEGVQGVELRLV